MTAKEKYPLIPMSEIGDEPRKIAIAWHESATNWIGDKHKLASDIQNYGINCLTAYRTDVLSAIERGEDIMKLDLNQYNK